MNSIEQTVEPKNGAIDLHVDVPTEWEGYVLKVTVERTEAKIEKPKGSGLSRFRAKWANLIPRATASHAKGIRQYAQRMGETYLIDTSACSK